MLDYQIPSKTQEQIEVAREKGNYHDERFLDQLVDGYRWQVYVLNAIMAEGYWGRVHPLRVRPDRRVASRYSDSFDILIGGYNGWFVDVEVKARSQRFDSPDTFPFETVLVEPMRRFEARDGDLPDYWAVVSTVTGSIMIASSTDIDEWVVETKMGVDYAACPRELFVTVDEFCETIPPVGEHSDWVN